MRSTSRLAAVVGMVTFAFAASFAAQQPAAPAAPPPAEPAAQAPPPAVYQPNALAGEKDFVVGVQPPFVWGPLENPKPNVPDGFTPIFNGENLAGWHTSRINRHGKTPDFRAIDGVIVGEPDGAVVEILSGAAPGDVAGLVFRDGGGWIVNPERPFEKKLDELPFPRWDLLPHHLYAMPRSAAAGEMLRAFFRARRG